MWTKLHLKNVLVALLIELYCIILSCFSANVREQYFYKQPNLAVKGSAWLMSKPSIRSELECCARCLHKDCVACRYDTSSQICHTSNVTIPGGDTVIYNREYFCPGDKGYILWMYADMRFCMMYNSTAVQNQAAKQHCEDDGGHLLLMKSDAMRIRVKASLETMGATGHAYVDGQKLPNNNVIAWNGQPVPWLKWGSGNPDKSDEECMHGKLEDSFLLRDTECWVTYPFVCQIDI